MIPWTKLLLKSTAAGHLHLSFRKSLTTQRLFVCFSSSMSGSFDLQPQKRILGEESSENLLSSSSKKPRLVEETIPRTGSISVPPNVDASLCEDASTEIVEELDDTRMPVDGDESLAQTEEMNQPGSSGLRGNQSKGKKKRIRPPHRSRNQEDEEKGTLLSPTEPKALRLPKRLCALLLGFCGSGYRGMQIQPGPIPLTIENVLFNALVKVGAVSQDNADNPTKVGLARAARTDAGVHAAGNVVSLKMIITIPGVEDLIASINEQLPPAIRVWGYGRVQKSFNARLNCESRKYTYFFPTYLLIPPKPGSGIHRALMNHVVEHPDAPSDFWEQNNTGSQEEDLVRKRSWRVGQEQVQSLRNIVQQFEGTRNYHNFTVGRDPSDPSCKRHMKKIQVSDPVVYGETEWISVLFHGQSFMLHQRKMMAIVVLSCRLGTPTKIMKELYGPKTVLIPKMPALGLLLEEPLFDSYNQRMAALNEKLEPTDAEFRPVIDFDIYRDKINTFKQKYIYSNMREVEDRDGLFDAWVRSLDLYAGNDLLYLSPSGIIPDVAVIKKGMKRENPFKEKRVFDSTSFPDKSKLEDGSDAEVEDNLPANKRDLAEMEG